MIFGFSRREFLGALPFGLAAQVRAPAKKGKPLPVVGEFARFTDPLTENTVVRLTLPSANSVIPYARNRFISARERIILFSSDRSGHFQPFQLDLRNGAVRQLTETAKLQPRSLSLDRQEKLVRYLDGDSLFEVPLGHGSPRQLASDVSAFANAADGSVYLIANGKLILKQGSESRMLAEAALNAWPQPDSAGCLFTRSTIPDECELYYVAAGGGSKPLLLASGRVREPFWDSDGQSVLFLRDVTTPNGTLLAEIHGMSVHGTSVHGNAEYSVSPTSQFAVFAPNSNASVFVGASRSRAQPNVVLQLRTPHREMTLCEHRATHPSDVSPIFSPDNRRIYFESDHEGHSAIYSVNVELLVEPE